MGFRRSRLARTDGVRTRRSTPQATASSCLDYPQVALPGGMLAAGGNAPNDLKAALDNIFNHPNVGPFIARQLIQRLVTSNPEPGLRRARGIRLRAQSSPRASAGQAWRPQGGGESDPARSRSAHRRAAAAQLRQGARADAAPDPPLARARCAARRPAACPSGTPTTTWARRRCARRRCSISSVPSYQPTGELSDLGLAAPGAAARHRLQAAARPTTRWATRCIWYYLGNPQVGPDDISVDLARDCAAGGDSGRAARSLQRAVHVRTDVVARCARSCSRSSTACPTATAGATGCRKRCT